MWKGNYVRVANMLLLTVFEQHFKTYHHLWFLTTLPKKFSNIAISRKFLPPGLSYNICDSHFAHFKVKVDKAVKNFRGPQTTRDISWLLGQYGAFYGLFISIYSLL